MNGNKQLSELQLQRGRLLERIASQRETLRQDFVPVSQALGKVDSAVAAVHSAAAGIRRHPVMASAAVAVLFWAKGKSLLRWGGKAFSLWQSWRLVQATIADWGGRVRM